MNDSSSWAIPSRRCRSSFASAARAAIRARLLLQLLAVGLPLCGATADATALGITLRLEVALSGGLAGDFGIIRIDEASGGDLAITIALDSVLGSDADLRELYFNLEASALPGLGVSSSRCNGMTCTSPFALEAQSQVKGGAGSEFDFAVSFGEGGGARGNATLQVASFVLGADPPLALAEVLATPSFTSSGIGARLAAHVQGTSNFATVAVPVPEAQTMLLMLIGLAGLALGSRRPGRTPRGRMRRSARPDPHPPPRAPASNEPRSSGSFHGAGRSDMLG